MIDYQFFPVQNLSLFSREYWFAPPPPPPPNLTTNSVSHPAASFRCMQITISDKSGMDNNKYPTCHLWNYCSSLKSWAFSEWYVKDYRRFALCHVKRPAQCLWYQLSYPVAMWALVEDDHIKRRPCPSPNIEGNSFISATIIRVELIMRIWDSNLNTAAAHCWMRSTQMWHTVFGTTGWISTSPKGWPRLNKSNGSP